MTNIFQDMLDNILQLSVRKKWIDTDLAKSKPFTTRTSHDLQEAKELYRNDVLYL